MCGVRTFLTTGATSTLCFDRRHTTAERASQYTVHLKTHKLAEHLKKALSTRSSWDPPQGYGSVASIKAEELVAYEYENSTAALDVSSEAWARFLTSWGVRPDHEAIRGYLSERAGTRPAPEPASSKIFNFYAVKMELESANLGYLLQPSNAIGMRIASSTRRKGRKAPALKLLKKWKEMARRQHGDK